MDFNKTANISIEFTKIKDRLSLFNMNSDTNLTRYDLVELLEAMLLYMSEIVDESDDDVSAQEFLQTVVAYFNTCLNKSFTKNAGDITIYDN